MILPGATIGIIGGGQLGRMLAVAASTLGYKTHIFTPEQDSPASHVATFTTIAPYNDAKALEEFANAVDVITFEFENVPHESLEMLESKKPVCPSAHVLKISRNRLREKTFINEQGIPTASFAKVTSVKELKDAAMAVRFPAILKTTELGYDGKGQITMRAGSDLRVTWDAINTSEAILESFVEFRMEISVIVARGKNGETRTYTPVQNIHKNHILDSTIAPAPINKALADKAEAIAVKIAKALHLQGLLAVEMFVSSEDDEILVNEIAPRPHNSGHWTMDAAITSQFEQAIRAVCGLPLGSTEMLCNAEMKNLIGNEVKEWEKYLKDPHAKLHLYGKKEIRPGRKMGHVNFIKREA
jgi:5-(carboxyamino)imidazole ribonucleotide synthase